MGANFRKESRLPYEYTHEGNANHEDLRVGALLRIADAVEKMAQSWDVIIEERDMYERWWREESERHESTLRSAAALRGVITKMKQAGGGTK